MDLKTAIMLALSPKAQYDSYQGIPMTDTNVERRFDALANGQESDPAFVNVTAQGPPPIPGAPPMPISQPLPTPPGNVLTPGPMKDRPTDAYKLRLIQMLGTGGAYPPTPQMTLKGGLPETIMNMDPAMKLAMMRGAK